jgi:predicted anti-sigma-YlaC factor YlaD
MLARGPIRDGMSLLAALLLASVAAGGCSVRKLAIGKIGDALAGGGGVYATDDDPELVGAALPFALKTMEGLLAQDRDHEQLLLAAASGFTQYAWGWVQLPGQRLQDAEYEASLRQLDRARRLYLRGRDYGLRGLERRHPGIGERLRRDPDAAVAAFGRDDLPLAFWTGAGWAGAIAVGKDQPELLADLPVVQALVRRVLEVDERWSDGAAHEISISLAAALPAAMGGGAERARHHFGRAVAIAGGRHASPYLALAEAVAVPAQDRAEYETLLEQALAVDVDAKPASRLANLLAQEQAAWLLARAGERFFDDAGDDEWPEESAPEESVPEEPSGSEGGGDGSGALPP